MKISFDRAQSADCVRTPIFRFAAASDVLLACVVGNESRDFLDEFVSARVVTTAELYRENRAQVSEPKPKPKYLFIKIYAKSPHNKTYPWQLPAVSVAQFRMY